MHSLIAASLIVLPGPELFERNGAVYVVDVQGMPALIRALFALPAMRRRPYRVLLDEDGSKTAQFPGGATTPTVMLLDRARSRAFSHRRRPLR